MIFRRFPGFTAEDIACFAPKSLGDVKPEVVVVIAGTNDLTKAVYENGTVQEYKIVENSMIFASFYLLSSDVL